jgi:hypothetical protein
MAGWLEGAAEAIVIRPGDTLLVRVLPTVPADHAHEIQQALRQWLPGVEVGVVAAEELAVYRPGDPPPETANPAGDLPA